MRIAINCRSLLKPQRTGIGRYTHHLIDSLARLPSPHDYLLYAPHRIFDFKRKPPVSPAKNFCVCRDRFNQGPHKSLGPVDVYHLPSPDAVDMPPPTKVVVTVHDLIYKTFPDGHTQETLALSEQKMRQVLKRADHIICCSQTTYRDLHRFFDVEASRSCVIYQGVDHTVFFPLVQKEIEKIIVSPDSSIKPYQKLILNYIEKNGFITDALYSKITKRAKATRVQDLNDLIKRELIVRLGEGRGTYYKLPND